MPKHKVRRCCCAQRPRLRDMCEMGPSARSQIGQPWLIALQPGVLTADVCMLSLLNSAFTNQHSKMPTDVLEESRQTTHASWYSGAA